MKTTRIPKVKEPVRLRMKQLSDGSKSLYLDIYHDGKRKYEFLRLYLIPERTAEDRLVNSATMKAANTIKAARIVALANGKAGIKQQQNISMEEWIDTLIKKKISHVSISSIRGLQRLKGHLSRFASSVMIYDINKRFCIDFIEYLKRACPLYCTPGKESRLLATTTQMELFNTLSIVLNEAVREEIIPLNPTRLLSSKEKIKKREGTRAYLTADEVKRLIATPISDTAQNDKAAFLFACFCGLRYSDIVALRWRHIIETEENTLIIRIRMKKTGCEVTVPLSDEALSFLPAIEKKNPDRLIFNLPTYAVTRQRLRKWVENAGIKKKVTFHVSRHTFATMMLTAGADLFVVSKLLGHADIGVTQIYARIVDKKKEEAISLLSRLF